MSSSDALAGTSTDGPGSAGGPGVNGGSVGPVSSSSGTSTTTTTGVAAKITNVKAASDPATSGVVVASSSASVTTATGIKVATAGTVATAIGTPIALNTSQTATTTAIRAISAGGQPTQVRVVMPTGIMPPTMIKQIDGAATGRTQITAIPTANARSVSNTAITVTRPVTQATYLPRAGVTAAQMAGVGVAAAQRLVNPIRATPVAAGSATVTGLTAAGSFVRGTPVAKNTGTPASTVITSGTSTWIAANNSTGQVQLIRAIPQPTRQRIITTQGITTGGTAVPVSGAATATVSTGGQSNNQAGSSPGGTHSQQQTYVATLATVIPPRQHQATLVYSSTQPISQPQAFNPAVATGQRFAVATPLSAAVGAVPRQIRPIPLGKSFSAAKLNTTSISIRAPNIPQLTSTVGAAVAGAAAGGTASGGGVARSAAVAAAGNVIPTASLATTRIIQLQQQPGATTQQLLGATGRLAGNVMLQPIIVNTTGAGKFGLRPPVTMATKVQPSLTITQLDIGKLPAAGTVSSSGSPSPSLVTPTSAANVAMATSSSGPTVLPLAISTRGGAASNILTGTITPIKSANCITVGKVMPQAQVAAGSEGSGGGGQSGVGATATNVYIHHAASPQLAHNATAAGNTTATSSAASTVLASTGNTTSATFLPPGSTIYYESVPASSVQVSSGVLSLTTTTVTSSTLTQNQNANTISSLPFGSHTASSTATFTVVPSSGARTFGQLHIPVSSAGTQIQAVPVRLSAQLAAGSSVVDTIAVSQGAQGTANNAGSQILIPTHHQGTHQPHMVIPLQTSIKVTTGANTGSAVFSNFLRKRDAEGNALRAAKNLGPTLISMGSSSVMGAASPSTSTSSSVGLTVEALSKADRLKRPERTDSPASSDGSTTVSANSSPGVEQQMQDGNLMINCLPGTSESTHFNPINELYANHHSMVMQHHLSGSASTSRSCALEHQRLNGSECLSRKKSRRLTLDSQQSHTPYSLAGPSMDGLDNTPYEAALHGNIGAIMGIMGHDITRSKLKITPQTAGNKENAKPTEYVLRRPRQCTLLNSYKQSWKAANNHFQRYTDVKPREERRPNVVDIANQANMMNKVNGWKIHHLRTQMKDLCKDENQIYDKLSKMLKSIETHGKSNESERITDLIKGNMQRSKIIVEGINEAQSQIMKIFDHKTHVSDIIQRCASKRNFKKREKL